MAFVHRITTSAASLRAVAARRQMSVAIHPPITAADAFMQSAANSVNNWVGRISNMARTLTHNLTKQQGSLIATTEVAETSTFEGIWLNKRTFQPSIKRRKRRHGFLRRQTSLHGSEIIGRRRAKGRARTTV